MTLTLKIQWHQAPALEGRDADSQPPLHEHLMWYADVVSAQRIDQLTVEQLRECGTERYDREVEIHCCMTDDIKIFRTVIGVLFADGFYRILAVERAWLLGPDGGTVDRIAP